MTDDDGFGFGFGSGEWRSETELHYCPRCGSALEGETVVECPEHGPLSLDHWEVPEDDFLREIFAHADDEEWLEMMFGQDMEGDGSEFDAWLVEEVFGAPPEKLDFEDAQAREQSSGGGVRDRINRLLGRGR